MVNSHTFGGKKYETSSKLNKVPPIGAPKATATPAAHAALRISRRLAEARVRGSVKEQSRNNTFIIFILAEKPTDDVTDATSNMYKWTFFAKGKARCNG